MTWFLGTPGPNCAIEHPVYGKISVESRSGPSSITVVGDQVPTVHISRRGGAARRSSPIETLDPAGIEMAVGGQLIEVVHLRRSIFRIREDDYLVTDGHGSLFGLEPEGVWMRRRQMRARSGIRPARRRLIVRRHRDGHIDVKVPAGADVPEGEIALAMAMAAAFGTTTLKVSRLPLSVVMFLVIVAAKHK
ncbi:hypothetical protein AAFP35_04920 [Gordonia sp. CPCC 206044]|uniref:hypothetical protein n=1 Tax=Gordonia sp. CPCC 206044 TaxID=3140793 RepID=UPI003AF3C1C8